MFSSCHVVISVKWIQSEQGPQQRSVSLTARLGLRKKKAIIIKSNDNDNDKEGSETKTYHQCERRRDHDA
jgi:hypothetical protein